MFVKGEKWVVLKINVMMSEFFLKNFKIKLSKSPRKCGVETESKRESMKTRRV